VSDAYSQSAKSNGISMDPSLLLTSHMRADQTVNNSSLVDGACLASSNGWRLVKVELWNVASGTKPRAVRIYEIIFF
jgi:hypothetical protein